MATTEIKKLLALPQPACFVCGKENPRGLHIEFSTADQRTAATWVPDTFCEGLQGIVHGGLVSAVLDEAMAKAVIDSGIQALTGELQVRFRRPVIAGCPVTISGWIVSQNRRVIRTEANLCDAEGTELAHASATFLPV